MSKRGRPLPPVPRGYQDDDGYEVPIDRRVQDNYHSINFGDGYRKVRVKKLPKNTSEDTLELYFESKRHFGRRMTVEKVELDTDNSMAVVTFETSTDAEFALQKHRQSPCRLNRQVIDVEPFEEVIESLDARDSGERDNFHDYSDIYESSGTDTIEVRGFSESCSEDMLQYYFENTKRSGGGDVTKFKMKRDQGFAHVTFRDKSVVQRVTGREHTVQGEALTVHPFVISKTELLLEEVPDTVSEENLANFMEAKLKVQVISVAFSQDRSRALVQFGNEFSYSKAITVCEKFQIGGVNVIPIQVPITNGIIVTNIPEDVTHDAVEVYFENTRRSKGGETVDVQVHDDEGYCLVFFKDAKVVPQVCQKTDHKLHSQQVDVKPYNKYFGLSDAVEGTRFILPEPITLQNKDRHKIQFLKSNVSKKSALEKELAECKAKIFWDDEPISIECTLTKDDKKYRNMLKTWSDDVLTILKHYTDALTVKKTSVDTHLWNAIRKEVGGLQMSDPNNIALIMEKDTKQIILVAGQGLADSAWQAITAAVEKVKREDKEKKESTTENKELAEWKIAYLKASHFDKDMQDRHKNLKMRFEDIKVKGKGLVYLTGSKETIHRVWIAMFERIQNVKERNLELDEEHIELLKNKRTIEKVKQSMKRKNVPDVWEVKPNCLVLHADEENDLTKMENAINATLAKFTITLDSGTEGVLKSKQWETTAETLRKKFSECVVISVNKGQLEIFTLDDIQDQVSDELNSFLKRNVVYKEEMTFTSHFVLYLKNVIRQKYDKELQSLKSRCPNLKIHLNEKNGAISIEGTSDGIKEAKRLMKSLQNSITVTQHKLEHPKVRKYLACSQGQECVQNVQRNIPCIIDLQGSGFKRSLHSNQTSKSKTFDKPTTCAKGTFKSGVKVIVVGGDITELSVDVLVNAANSELKHGGGLARVILNKGGQDIQTECDNRIQMKGSLKEGDVFMGKGGKLNCKFVAHAVGPHWRGGGNGEQLCLQKAVFACFEKTEKRNLKSIAMPALSAGMFQYPVDLSCMEILKAIDQHFQGTRSSIKEVYLCDISTSTVAAFTKALQTVCSDVKIQVDLGKVDGAVPSWLMSSDKSKPGKKSEPSGSVEIEVVKGLLATEKTDVIVNSTSPDLQLQRGALSKAILKSGGSKIQDDCTNNYPNGIDVGEVAVTSAGKLKCSNIYHIAIKHFDNRNARVCLQGINECISACLQEADKNGYTSISFPAMGTGAQKYPKDKVAKEMFKAVTTYSNNNPSTSLRKVRFVIYTEDDETYEVFVTEEKNWKDSNTQQRHGSRNLKPGLGKLVNESRGYAEFKIGAIKVTVHQGDITDNSSEAIVASCNMDLDLRKGAVTKALLKKGGDAIEKDCKSQRSTMQKEGIAVTTGGDLRAKYIIHVDTKYKTSDWTPVVKSCLRKAEKHKIRSLAFPALGTSVGCRPGDIAHVMCSAIVDFLQDNPTNVQEIQLVIFQQDMVFDFIKGMKESVVGNSRPHSGERHRPQRPNSSHHEHQAEHRKQKADHSEDFCTITIYAEDEEKAKKASKSFEKTIENEWTVKTIKDTGITRFTHSNIKELEAMAKNNHVDVTVNKDAGTIEVVGLASNVLEVVDAVHSRLRNADKSFYMRDQAKLMSNIVKWLYIKDQKEYPFPDRVNLEIETAYKHKEKQVKVKDRSGGEYNIDFGSMTEHDVNQPTAKFPVIRRDLVAGASFTIPKHWQKMDEKENLKIVTLNQQDAEYKKVLGELTKTLGRTPNIVKIERIQNKTLYTQYDAKRKELKVNNPNKSDNERMLWHGTADYAVASINSHGFNRSYCGKNATAIGQGVYFAVNANYSDQGTYSPPGSDGNKRMYRCLVLTGNYCNGSSDMRVPPPVDKTRPHILYDSVTNNTNNPIMFVVFNDTQAYPEHLITYK